jgi:putative peptidoglycan lipid II flippase
VTAQSTSSSIARASAIVGLGNIASRVLGLVREIVLATIFGASAALESFNNAVLVSRSIFDLLIAGHVSSAIVPVMSEIEEKEGRDALYRVLAAMAGLIVIVLAVVVILLIATSGVIAGLIDDDPETVELTSRLIQLTSPALLLMSLFALYSGALYALRIFVYPALAAVAFNATMVAATLIFASGGQIYGVALAWMLAAAAQLALQLYGLRSGKLAVSFRFRDPLVAPALRRIGLLYMPVIGALVVDLATTRLLTYALAARAAIDYGNTYMQWATTLIQFPQGLVATAISAAVLPTLSRAASSDDRQAYDDTLGLGLRLTTVLILPAAAAMAVLAVPIIQLLFENGAYTPADTVITANALRLYLIGLPFAAWDLLLIYAFYARQDTATPAAVGVVSLVVYTVAALLLFPSFGLYALMLADAVKHITHAALSTVLLIRRRGRLGDQRLLGTLAKTLVATAGMALAAYFALQMRGTDWGGSTLQELITVVFTLGVSGIVYAALAYILRIEEFRIVLNLIGGKLRR